LPPQIFGSRQPPFWSLFSPGLSNTSVERSRAGFGAAYDVARGHVAEMACLSGQFLKLENFS
jgi:hypothetical protein